MVFSCLPGLGLTWAEDVNNQGPCSLGVAMPLSYRKVCLLGTCTYIFWRNVLLNLPYLLSACAYREYC